MQIDPVQSPTQNRNEIYSKPTELKEIKLFLAEYGVAFSTGQ